VVAPRYHGLFALEAQPKATLGLGTIGRVEFLHVSWNEITRLEAATPSSHAGELPRHGRECCVAARAYDTHTCKQIHICHDRGGWRRTPAHNTVILTPHLRGRHEHTTRQKRLVPAYRRKVTRVHPKELTFYLALRLVLAVRPPLWHARLVSASEPVSFALINSFLSTAASHLVRHLLASLLYPDDILARLPVPMRWVSGGLILTEHRRRIHTTHPIHLNGAPGMSCRVTSSVVLLSSVIIYRMTFVAVEPATMTVHVSRVRDLVLASTDRYPS
jgi:hypothetical protein